MAADSDLGDLLAKELPTGADLTVRHVSSTPAPSAALFAAPPGQKPEVTFCESHFLSVSIHSPDHEGAEIIVFGMEVLVYTTTHLTTIFVSKADSTGFIHLLKLSQKFSVLRLISHTFLSYLARTHQRPGVRLVLSLFARAQNQYLFPGSIDNPEKHVLDDRGLIKWWCRAVDPILRENNEESLSNKDTLSAEHKNEIKTTSATAFLIVPGCDSRETHVFFPPSAKKDPRERSRWRAQYPVHQLCHNPSAPPRCLVPRLPDDPKTRFLIDLDDELPGAAEGENANATPSTGLWRSVKSLEQFWDLMSFRQECSAGRLVGFLWLVINPPGLVSSTGMASQTRRSANPTITANDPQPSNPPEAGLQDGLKGETSVAVAAEIEPAVSGTSESQAETATSFDRPPTASAEGPENPYYWPEAGRGEAVLSEADYKTMMDGILDHFYDEKEIVSSTKAFVEDVSSLADQLTWGKRVNGKRIVEATATEDAPVNNLTTGLIRKRKKPENEKNGQTIGAVLTDSSGQFDTASTPVEPAGVNTLNANLVRKKKKT